MSRAGAALLFGVAAYFLGALQMALRSFIDWWIGAYKPYQVSRAKRLWAYAVTDTFCVAALVGLWLALYILT